MNAKKRFLLLLLSLFAGNILLLAQVKRTVTGVVKDNNGVGLTGVTINEKGTKKSVTTNNDGGFSITVNTDAILNISYTGFVSKEVSVSTQGNIEVILEAKNNALNEVVVTALGIKKQKRQLGFSVTEVKGADLAKTNEINPINALQGKVAGVQIDQGAGGLFGNSKIVIRGNSTLGTNNQPIFVVDGVIMDNGVFNGSGRDFGNDFKNLNTEDFETVSILKGSSAAAL
jgi:iron complex outermembrane recepter protein